MNARTTLSLLIAVASTIAPISFAQEQSTARLSVTARVMPFHQAAVHHNLTTVSITDQDVLAGYKVLPRAATLEIRSNLDESSMVVLRSPDRSLGSVTASIGNRSVSLESGAGFLLTDPILGRTTVDMDYRIELAEGTTPGEYPLALDIEVHQTR